MKSLRQAHMQTHIGARTHKLIVGLNRLQGEREQEQEREMR